MAPGEGLDVGNRTVAVPSEAWAIGWAFLVGQLLLAVEAGLQDEAAWAPSAVLGVLLTVFFAHGVLRARTVRLVLVVVLMALAGLVELAEAVVDPQGWELVRLAMTLLQGWCLLRFTRTDWFAWQRTRPRESPSLVGPLLVAALVGVVGGMVGTDASAIRFEVSF